MTVLEHNVKQMIVWNGPAGSETALLFNNSCFLVLYWIIKNTNYYKKGKKSWCCWNMLLNSTIPLHSP